MPDISMCMNERCPSKLKCYRFMATKSDFQSYMAYKVPAGEDRCGSFRRISPSKRAPRIRQPRTKRSPSVNGGARIKP